MKIRSVLNRINASTLYSAATLVVFCMQSGEAAAQVDVTITPSDASYTIAAPPLCSKEETAERAGRIASQTVARDLLLSGKYRSEGPDKHNSPLGSCETADGGPFSDRLNAMGINLLVTGKVRLGDEKGRLAIFDFYAFDVAEGKPVLGKRYEGRSEDAENFGHQFANDLFAYLTGETGPFGSRIVFVSDNGKHRELFSMRLGSDERRQLTDEKGIARSPSWSKRGDSIVFSLERDNYIDLFTVAGNGGKARRITFLPGAEATPRLSPDGKTIVSSATISGAKSLALFNMRGRLTLKLTDSNANAVEPAWSPDGSRIIFTSDESGKKELFYISAEGGRTRPLVKRANSDCGQAAWSPGGQQIALVCTVGERRQIFLNDLQSGELSQLTFDGHNEHPTWSPDGRFIAYTTRFDSATSRDIAIFSLPALKTTVTLKTAEDEAEPAWAP